MAEPNLKDILERLGLRQSELARLLDVSPRTVSLWATGETALPGPVAAYLRVLRASTADVLAGELKRLPGRNKMLDEGVYGFSYKGQVAGEGALAVLRKGKVIGSDRWGGVFMGSYEFDEVRALNTLHVRLQVPPRGELVTGFEAGPEGAILDIVGEFERAAPVSCARVDVAGQPVVIELTYLGPLPN